VRVDEGRMMPLIVAGKIAILPAIGPAPECRRA
jgi:hypothetical protein